MVKAFNATFNNISVISWQSVLLVEQNRVPGENHWPVASHEHNLQWGETKFTSSNKPELTVLQENHQVVQKINFTNHKDLGES